MCFAFPTTTIEIIELSRPMTGLSQEREGERGKKVNETEKTANISMDDDEQQKFQLCLVGGLGGISFSLSLCKKQNAYSSFNALQNQTLHALRYLRYRTFLIIHSSNNSSSNILGAAFSSFSFPPEVVSRTSRNPIQFFFLLLLSYLFISTTPKSSH